MASGWTEQIICGFSKGWECLIGTPARRVAFRNRIRQVRAHRRRWIYLATEKYAAMRDDSVRPSSLQSEPAREALLKRLLSRRSVSPSVRRDEIKALRQLDLPYFVRKTGEPMPEDTSAVPAEITEAIRNALLNDRGRSGKES